MSVKWKNVPRVLILPRRALDLDPGVPMEAFLFGARVDRPIMMLELGAHV
jgi:hypothetical protein